MPAALGRAVTGKHYRWQLHWRADLQAREARHDSGLVWRFEPGADAQPPPLGTCCRGADGQPWHGTVDGGEAALRDWLAAQPNLRDPGSQQGRLKRLALEAATTFAEALRHAG